MRSRSILISSILLTAVFMASGSMPAPVHAAACLSLQSDLSYGAVDASANGSVSLLQQYLAAGGYLSATPNGYFGPATFAAVQAFQAANGVPNSGYVGPLTRAALARLTCTGSAVAQTVQASQSAQGQPVPSAVASVPASSASAVTSPQGGQTLTVGQSFTISWNPQPYSRYDIILVSPTGAAGFIAQSLVNVNQYIWNVGTVFSSQSQSNQTVAAGSYQIRIQNSATGAEPSDPISDPFMIAAATLSAASVFPASVPADGVTAAVLYGSDFSSASSVTFTNTGARGQVLYTSPDGKVLVFSVPVGTSLGSQSVYVSDSSGQPSNQLSFTITNP